MKPLLNQVPTMALIAVAMIVTTPGRAWVQDSTKRATKDSTSRSGTPIVAPDETSGTTAPARGPLPFGVGEQLNYTVAVGGAKVGTGKMELLGIEDVRGEPSFHSYFNVQGGFLMFKVNDVLESWFDTTTLSSRRFIQRISEVNYKRERHFDIYPNRAVFQQQGSPEEPSVPQPLDDASFLYFVRTVPLVVGQTYTFHRYFRPDRNPVIVKVLRKERVKVPAGEFDTIVIQPIIKSQGIFADGGEAQMWLTDDDRRMMVQFKAKVPYLKTLDLYLQSYRPPTNASASRQ
jgi:hypothetical protein